MVLNEWNDRSRSKGNLALGRIRQVIVEDIVLKESLAGSSYKAGKLLSLGRGIGGALAPVES